MRDSTCGVWSEQDEETDDDEIDAVMEAAAATDAAGRGASPERWMKERQGFRDMDGGDDEGGSVGNCDDVDAVMAEAAMKSGAERDSRTREVRLRVIDGRLVGSWRFIGAIDSR